MARTLHFLFQYMILHVLLIEKNTNREKNPKTQHFINGNIISKRNYK